MTRIGFAYNRKPQPDSPLADAARRDDRSAPGASRVPDDDTQGAAVAMPVDADDEFAEWDTPETIGAVADALGVLGTVIHLEADGDFPSRLRHERPDIVFNIAEGMNGPNREAHVPAICEFYGIPYTASDPFTLSLCLDKARTKEALLAHRVRTAAWVVVRSETDFVRAEKKLEFPVFAKPLHEGSSKGITERNFCRTPIELREVGAFLLERYAEPVLVEEYLPGDEFTCAVMGNGRDAHVLPIIQMNFTVLPEGALPIYGFEAKWVWDTPDRPLDLYECPAAIPTRLTRAIEKVTLDAYRATGCRDWARIDVRLDAAAAPHVVEINPLPGILPKPEDNSCFPTAARAAGMNYDQLIQRCLVLAAQRTGVTLA